MPKAVKMWCSFTPRNQSLVTFTHEKYIKTIPRHNKPVDSEEAKENSENVSPNTRIAIQPGTPVNLVRGTKARKSRSPSPDFQPGTPAVVQREIEFASPLNSNRLSFGSSCSPRSDGSNRSEGLPREGLASPPIVSHFSHTPMPETPDHRRLSPSVSLSLRKEVLSTLERMDQEASGDLQSPNNSYVSPVPFRSFSEAKSVPLSARSQRSVSPSNIFVPFSPMSNAMSSPQRLRFSPASEKGTPSPLFGGRLPPNVPRRRHSRMDLPVVPEHSLVASPLNNTTTSPMPQFRAREARYPDKGFGTLLKHLLSILLFLSVFVGYIHFLGWAGNS